MIAVEIVEVMLWYSDSEGGHGGVGDSGDDDRDCDSDGNRDDGDGKDGG